jgi:hypothetical protein
VRSADFDMRSFARKSGAVAQPDLATTLPPPASFSRKLNFASRMPIIAGPGSTAV